MPIGAGLIAEVAHLLGGVALALAFALLTRRRLGAMVFVVRAQCIVVAVAAAWQAWAAAADALWGLALVLLLCGAALPSMLHRSAGADSATDTPPVPVAVAAAAVLVVLAILVALPMHLPGMQPLREDLALAVAVVLVGLLILPSRRAALPQLAGLLAVANGVALLAAVAGAALAWPMVLGIAGLFGIVAIGLAALPAAVAGR